MIKLKFACDECGKSLGIDEQYAGRKVKCPDCGTVMQVPQPQKFLDEGLSDLDDLAAMEASSQSNDIASMELPPSESTSSGNQSNFCPKCHNTISPNAVICVNCGHNLVAGKNVKTIERQEKAIAGVKKTGGIGVAIGISLVFSLIGAAIWAGIGIATGYEIGWVAWGIGALSGIGAVAVTKEYSMRVGAVAAGMAILGILAGKLMIIEWSISGGGLEEFTEEIVMVWPEEMVGDDETMYNVAMFHLEDTGQMDQKVIDWYGQFENMTDESELIEPSPELQEKIAATDEQAEMLVSKWSRSEKKNACKRYLRANAEMFLTAFGDELALSEKLISSFSFWDILWFFLAVSTAFKIGNGTGE